MMVRRMRRCTEFVHERLGAHSLTPRPFAAPIAALFLVAVGLHAQANAQGSRDPARRVYEGWLHYESYCAWCHGGGATGTAAAPDLRQSVSKHSMNRITDTIVEGVEEKGMPAWGQLLQRTEIESIYLYLKARSEKLVGPAWLDAKEIGLPARWLQDSLKARDGRSEADRETGGRGGHDH